MTHKIFIPFDGSDCSIRALQHAVTTAQRSRACSLHVAYAHDEPLLYGEIAVYVSREEIEKLQRQHGESVLGRADAILETAGIPYEKEILIGPVAQVLAERARTLGCDSIVMGTHGMTALGNMLMGSIATKVIHLSTVPVTLVK